MVAWAERPVDWPERGKCEADWPLPESVTIETCFDYLGRKLDGGVPDKLRSAPIFVVLPAGECEQFTLQSPARSALRPGSPCPIVLQCLMPKETSRQGKSVPWAIRFDHTVTAGIETEVPLFIYNFSDHEVSGTVSASKLPSGCQVQPDRWERSPGADGQRKASGPLPNNRR